MMRFKFPYTAMGFIFTAMLWLFTGCGAPAENEPVNIIQALSGSDSTDCFNRAQEQKQIVFPEDHGPHPGFKTEWWYYTGNLTTDTGRHFGYQLTFFRQALSCDQGRGISKWRTNQLYFAHFAVTDSNKKTFFSASRMNRESIGIAGARSRPHRVWIDDWQASEIQGKNGQRVLEAGQDGYSLRLILSRSKPVIFQGKNGLSRKGKGASNASYYYSLPRLATQGQISIQGREYPVTGNSWFDHEWSTSALDTDVAGWDWFSVHLKDGRDLMVCQIRKPDGSPNGFGFGSISYADGSFKILSENDFAIQVLDHWKSPDTGKRYPSKWQIDLPGQGISLRAVPVIPNQEHHQAFDYWEGAVRFKGTGLAGMGYVEMTGY